MSKFARKLAEKLGTMGIIRFDAKADYSFQHYSFSPNQKSNGAWSWELLKNGVPEQIGSNHRVHDMLAADAITVASHGSLYIGDQYARKAKP